MAYEGLKYVVPMAVLAVGCLIAVGQHWLTYLSAVLCGLLFLFFRLPPAPAKADEKAVLSPAGGFVIEIVIEEEDVFLKQPAQRISIFMSPMDVHVNTAPVDGIVRYADYRRGTFFKADKPEARLHNERMSVGIERPDGMKCLATQVAGWFARRIVCDVKIGETVKRGHRYGLIQFGSRMDLHLPAHASIFVKPGQHVRAAKTVLAAV